MKNKLIKNKLKIPAMVHKQYDGMAYNEYAPYSIHEYAKGQISAAYDILSIGGYADWCNFFHDASSFFLHFVAQNMAEVGAMIASPSYRFFSIHRDPCVDEYDTKEPLEPCVELSDKQKDTLRMLQGEYEGNEPHVWDSDCRVAHSIWQLFKKKKCFDEVYDLCKACNTMDYGFEAILKYF